MRGGDHSSSPNALYEERVRVDFISSVLLDICLNLRWCNYIIEHVELFSWNMVIAGLAWAQGLRTDRLGSHHADDPCGSGCRDCGLRCASWCSTLGLSWGPQPSDVALSHGAPQPSQQRDLDSLGICLSDETGILAPNGHREHNMTKKTKTAQN